MAQKRPPLPIFNNKSKRPRQALVAHPLNSGAPSDRQSTLAAAGPHQGRYQQSYRQPSTAANSYTYSHPSPANNRGYHHHQVPTTFGLENRAPTASLQSNSYNSSVYHQPRESVNAYHQRAPSVSPASDCPAQSRNTTPLKQRTRRLQSQFVKKQCPATQTAQLQLMTTGSTCASAARSSVGSATATAKEPSRDMAAKQSSASTALVPAVCQSVKRKTPSLRILTATAQGMRHWSQYKKHSPLLFEVYGRLSSPTTLVRGQTRCKQFQLSTSDGSVKCTYWEMGKCLPPLVQGRTIRVVGQWDVGGEVMQCYSVREVVDQAEEMTAKKAVEASDKSMRQFVAELMNQGGHRAN